MTRILSVAAVCLTVVLIPLASYAQVGPAGRYLKRHHDRINSVIRRPARTEAARQSRGDQVTAILRELLDLDAMARTALGDHWDEHDEESRAEFVRLLRGLVERSYRESLETTAEYRVDYGAEAPRGDHVTLPTLARDTRNRRAPEITIEYLLRAEGERYRVEDITTDGVSMVRNYRSQFDRIIRREGWDALLERMRQRLSAESL